MVVIGKLHCAAVSHGQPASLTSLPPAEALPLSNTPPESVCCALQVPDIMSLQRPQELTVEEGVAAVVKFGLGNLFSLAAKV